MCQLQQLDLLLKAKKKGANQLQWVMLHTRLAMDSLKLMTFVYCDLSYRRRELIVQPDKNEEFKALCSNDHPVTDNLFSDDLRSGRGHCERKQSWFQNIGLFP